ncbi:MAG TPA: AAA family ATPase [bacterium]|nr:AAA family ATPase [bacterium]
MSITSRWITEFDKQVLRGKHALLYGNVHDQSIYRDNYMTALDFQQNYFLEKRYEIIAGYDPIEGVHFPVSEMKKIYDETLRKAVLQNVNCGFGSDPNPDTNIPPNDTAQQQLSSNPRVAPARRLPQAVGSAARPRMDEAFAGFRRLLAQRDVSVAVLVDIVDMLTSDPERYAQEEREALMQLKKCSLEAAFVRKEHHNAGYRNTLVITAGDINRVPQWLYRENPLVSIVHVARPSKEERKHFYFAFQNQFYTNGGIDDNQKTAEEFSNLTEGLQTWDLEALKRTSCIEKIPVGKPSKLVDFFKFGVREDPWERIDHESVKKAGDILSRRVIGQPQAIEAVTTMLTSARVGLGLQGGGKSSQPKGVFFFVGPTGVGKTELAKALTEFVFSDESAFERFDMSEYKEEHAAEKLTGAPPGYVGYEDSGRLVRRMMEKPHSILLFDEIEKAHPRVLDKFLQILEDGRLTDGRGQTVYFNQSAIIFTSNIGATKLVNSGNSIQDMNRSKVHKFFKDSVKSWFFDEEPKGINRAELYNRLGDNIIPFDILRPEYVKPIAEKFINQLAVAAVERFQLSIAIDESVYQNITQQMQENGNLLLGGRRIKTMLQDAVVNPFNRWLFENLGGSITNHPNSVLLSINTDGKLEVKNV